MLKPGGKPGSLPGLPEYTYVSDIFASSFDENIVIAAFSNLKPDYFKTYLLRSTKKGSTWTSIASNLQANGPVHTVNKTVMEGEAHIFPVKDALM